MKPKLFKNVHIGDHSVIGEYCILGIPPRGKKSGQLSLKIGKRAQIRPFAVLYAGSTIGDNFETGTLVSIREDNFIGNNVVVGTGSTLEHGNTIGDRVRIHSGCFLEMADIESDVFIGPHVILTDDLHPPCPKYEICRKTVKIKRNAKIGAGVVILPGITIGRGALVGAGSVVTKDVPDNAVTAGNPSRVRKYIDELKCTKGLFKKPYDWLKLKKRG